MTGIPWRLVCAISGLRRPTGRTLLPGPISPPWSRRGE